MKPGRSPAQLPPFVTDPSDLATRAPDGRESANPRPKESVGRLRRLSGQRAVSSEAPSHARHESSRPAAWASSSERVATDSTHTLQPRHTGGGGVDSLKEGDGFRASGSPCPAPACGRARRGPVPAVRRTRSRQPPAGRGWPVAVPWLRPSVRSLRRRYPGPKRIGRRKSAARVAAPALTSSSRLWPAPS